MNENEQAKQSMLADELAFRVIMRAAIDRIREERRAREIAYIRQQWTDIQPLLPTKDR